MAAEDKPLPGYVQSEFDEYLKCGRLEQGFLRVFNIDIETCSTCGGAMKVIASIEDPVVIHKILNHLDSKVAVSNAFHLPDNRAPPQADLFY
jgi:hypothetical protein